MLKLSGQGPLYLQLYRAIQQDILSGALTSGDQLPATRELARALCVSRNAVVQCYEKLASEGYVYSRQGSGSFVSELFLRHGESPEHAQMGAARAVEITDNAKSMLPMWRQYRSGFDEENQPLIDFQYGHVATDVRLERQLRQILRQQGAGIYPTYQHPAGINRLRKVIAKYIKQHRGVKCTADQIVVTNGSQEALSIVIQMLVGQGDTVVMEEPGYRGATQAFRSVSADIHTVEVDEQGLCTDLLCDDPNVRLLYTTPSHQFPTGGVLPLERRLALLNWAKRNKVMILEDDYDSEFRYHGPPMESIQGMDKSNRTIYMGTFSKIISPVLRTGFLVLPEELIDPACAIKWTQNRHSPVLIQLMLAEYLDSIHFIRHLRRMSKRYAERRATLIDELDQQLGGEIEIHGTNAGIHLLVWLNLPIEREPHLLEVARFRGVFIHTATNLYRRPPERIGLLLGYANLSSLEIRKGVKIIAECLHLVMNDNDTRD